jgi:hypothetical protein
MNQMNPIGRTKKMDMRIHALGTASILLSIRDQGRLALSQASTQAIARAEAIVEGDRVLGTVCTQDLHDAIVPQMAENAYVIALLCQDLDGMGLIEIVGEESLFFSPVAVEMSAAGFSLVSKIKG